MSYADVEIRIFARVTLSEGGREVRCYPVELTLNGGGEFPRGYIDPSAQPPTPTTSDFADERYGEALFRWLFSDKRLSDAWAAIRGEHARCRVRLRLDPEEPELHRVVWEALRDPGDEGLPLSLAATDATPFSRYLPLPSLPGRPISSRPIRILLVAPAQDDFKERYPADDYPGLAEINPLAELASLSTALQPLIERGSVAPPTLLAPPCSLDHIIDELRNGDGGKGHHILHLVCHGDYSAADGKARLWLASDHNVLERVPDEAFASGLGRLLSGTDAQNEDTLRLVFLAGCETATRSSADAFRGAAPQLARAGVPAVVAMQDQVGIETAREFSAAFYRHLLKDGQVDVAANVARATIIAKRLPGPVIPVLFLRLRDGLLLLPERWAVSRERKPYKGLRPYTRADADLFYGRSEEIGTVCRRLSEYPLTVVHGEPGVGLSSLMAAGVGPELAARDTLAVFVTEHCDLVQEVRLALIASGREPPLRLAGDAPLPQALQAACAGDLSRIVLVFDQAERIMDLQEDQQGRLVRELEESLHALGEALRIVLAVHRDAQPALSDILRPLCKWPLTSIPLPPLSREGAEEAIVRPLRALNWPVTLSTSLAEHIADELISLSDRAGRVDPGALQVVCERLYQEALVSEFGPVVTPELYAGAGWAEGILAAHAEEMLDQLGNDRPVAEQILARIASAPRERWVPTEQLSVTSEAAVRTKVLQQLREWSLLDERRIDGQPAYAFANRIVADRARKMRTTTGQLAAEGEIDRIWEGWDVGRGTLATRGQLRYLQQLVRAGAAPRVAPHQLLLLLRSAVAHREPPSPWLDWMSNAAGKAFIRQLEIPSAPVGKENQATHSDLEKAALLLATKPPAPGETGEQYGTVARAAVVSAARADVRQTAALALGALSPTEAVNRLDWASQSELRGWSSRLRRIELRGALIDALPETTELQSGLSVLDRAGIWLWRVCQGVLRDSSRVLGLTGGGALGAGIFLGLLRGGTASALDKTPGVYMILDMAYGMLLGAALVFGLLLAGLLSPRRQSVDQDSTAGESAAMQRASLNIGLGSFLFGIMLILVASLRGMPLDEGNWLVALVMGLVAGLGLSVAAYGRPLRGGQVNGKNWLARLAFAPIGLALSHLGYVFLSPLREPEWYADSSPIVQGGRAYWNKLEPWLTGKLENWNNLEQSLGGKLANLLEILLRNCKHNSPRVTAGLGLFDAALVGIVLALGLHVGLLVADRLIQRSHEVNDGMGN